MTFTSQGIVDAECYGCGETTACTLLVADGPERETGYIDEVTICEKCEDKRSYTWHW